MKYFNVILILYCTNLLSQSILEQEKNWISSSNKNHTSYYSIFLKNNLTDSLANNFDFSPDVHFAYQDKKFAFLSGIKVFGEKRLNKNLSGSYFLASSVTNSTNTKYIGDLQGKSFFSHNISPNLLLLNDLRGRIEYKKYENLFFQSGIDNHFIGEGDRSLLIGNHGAASPFVSMQAKFWKFDYFSIHQVWREGTAGHYTPKINSTHYLNFNLGSTFSFGIFETVVHGVRDTIYNRGFEVEYLNPLIFYRPQEYSIGSSDNVLLGLNGFITWKRNRLYGQIILDDINIQEIRNKSKWWANKYGIQAGYKGWFSLKNTELFIRSEINLVTPYSYSAKDIHANYSNQGVVVAHPLGANFIEWFNEAAFNLNKTEFHIWSQFYMKGNDYENNPLSYGGDIDKSYILRPYGDYGYSLGVGEKFYRFQFATNISRIVSKNSWKVFAEPRLILITRKPKIEQDFFILLGLHKDFGTVKRNY
jgi:hypothetical protein